MASKATNSVESIDLKEVVGRIDMASGLFAHAAQSFADMASLFEAIQAASPAGSLTARLAQLGINACETNDSDFVGYTESYIAHVEGYSAALADNPFRRFPSGKDSSQGGT